MPCYIKNLYMETVRVYLKDLSFSQAAVSSLGEEKKTDSGQQFSICLALGRHWAKTYLQNLMGLKDFRQSLHDCKDLREEGMDRLTVRWTLETTSVRLADITGED